MYSSQKKKQTIFLFFLKYFLFLDSSKIKGQRLSWGWLSSQRFIVFILFLKQLELMFSLVEFHLRLLFMLRQEASIPSLVGLSVVLSSIFFWNCQRNLYLGQAVARMLYSGVKTADHVYTVHGEHSFVQLGQNLFLNATARTRGCNLRNNSESGTFNMCHQQLLILYKC